MSDKTTTTAGTDSDPRAVLAELFAVATTYKAAIESDTLGDQNEEDMAQALSDAEVWLLQDIAARARRAQPHVTDQSARQAAPEAPPDTYPTFEHADDAAVDRFAAAMKMKMAASRAKGRDGWDNEALCPAARLQSMLVEHLRKGDPVDIGNFAMMLWNRGERVIAPATSTVGASGADGAKGGA